MNALVGPTKTEVNETHTSRVALCGFKLESRGRSAQDHRVNQSESSGSWLDSLFNISSWDLSPRLSL